MTLLVVDASFIAAAIFEEDYTAFARRVLLDNEHLALTAPGLMAWELASIIWKKRRRGQINSHEVAGFAPVFQSFGVAFIEPPAADELATLAQRAEDWGVSAYDAAYMDHAIQAGLPFATTDRGLTRAAVAAGLVVHSPFV